MRIRDIMQENVVHARPEDSVQKVAELMERHNIGALPVLSDSGLVGIVTDRDIVVRGVTKGTQALRVENVMTSRVVSVTPDTNVQQAMRLMAQEKIRRVPVWDGQQLVGMVAMADLATSPEAGGGVNDMLNRISQPGE